MILIGITQLSNDLRSDAKLSLSLMTNEIDMDTNLVLNQLIGSDFIQFMNSDLILALCD